MFLNTRCWTIGEKVKPWLRKSQKAEVVASEVKALVARGMAVGAIAPKLKTNWLIAKAALAIARAGSTAPTVLPPAAPMPAS